ncbi:MAG: AtpZ/AtpI family protein [Chloroflexi bacterium]|nr:AtpZ/AtpI family protein [Chloroflexota bacterium]
MRRLTGPMRLMALGWYVALCITVGILAGLWLDQTLNTLPLFTLVGLLLGLTAAFVGLYRMVSAAVEADAAYTAADAAAIAAARAARAAAEGGPEREEPEDPTAAPPDGPAPDAGRQEAGAGMSAWELEARLGASSEPRPEDQREEQR